MCIHYNYHACENDIALSSQKPVNTKYGAIIVLCRLFCIYIVYQMVPTCII